MTSIQSRTESGDLQLLKTDSARDISTRNFSTQGAEVSEETSNSAAISRKNPDRSFKLAMAAAKTAAENMGTDIVVLDMTEHTALFDYFVIITGASRRQLHAISEEIDHQLEDEMGDKRLNREGYDESRWIILDYGTVVIHIFDDETRAFYSLENLWADAKKVDISKEVGAAARPIVGEEPSSESDAN